MSYHKKYEFQKKKDINVKAFTMITNKNEAKAMAEHNCDCKSKFNCSVCNSNQKWSSKTCQCECKNDRTCKKNLSWNPSTRICENSKCLKSTSVTECDEIISVMDIVSTKKTYIKCTASVNCHSINVRDCYILHKVLLTIILLLIIIIFCYHYAKQKGRI